MATQNKYPTQELRSDTKYPRRGVTPVVISLAVLAFVLVMVLLFFFLRRNPQSKPQTDKPQSSSVLVLDGDRAS